MFQFPPFASRSAGMRDRSPAGCPIRTSADRWAFAPPAAFRGLSRPSSPPRAKASPCALRSFRFTGMPDDILLARAKPRCLSLFAYRHPCGRRRSLFLVEFLRFVFSLRNRACRAIALASIMSMCSFQSGEWQSRTVDPLLSKADALTN